MPRSFLVLLVWLSSANAANAFSMPVPRPQLCAWSDLVVVADVAGAEARWAQGPRGDLETVSDLAVLRTVRGQAPRDLFVRTPGGRLSGLVQQVEDAAVLAPGARYLLMLRKAPDGDGWIVVGGEAGAVRLGQGGEREDAAVASVGACRAP